MKENPKARQGAKKPPLHVIPPQAELWLGQAMQNGADEYGLFNWREDHIDALTYYSANRRHWMAWLDGEDFCRKSKVHHLAHAMACAAIVLDSIENECLIDNRPPKGNAAELIERLTKK